ncbi:LysR family transcriptional regulator [Variovorax fucosicus]|uniref:LysR family transcriptional regulator n=1 Tax=Variovorax fucosicus TaxID=3053517 RepID=UPI00257562CD|nr:LysR family transcriptional regulator [Variovorax sp. J22G47]MDM0059120.1 LysR family transcriptional regulator [Variovorax sp. J22G47]
MREPSASRRQPWHVCEAGSAAAAAEKSSVVTSAVSKRLSQLEAQIGTPLLLRKRHGMVPTVAGQTLLEHARLLLHTAEQMDHDLKAQAAGGWGQVRVLASVSSMMGPLVPDIGSFLRKHANISVDLEEASTPRVVEGVRQGLATLGVGWSVGDLSNLEGVPYRSDELCVVVPSGHPLSRRSSVKFDALLAHELVAQPPTSALQVLMRQLAAKAGMTFRQRVVVHSYDTALRVVQAGLAAGIVPRTVAQVTGVALGLKQIDLDEPWAVRQFVICHRGESALTPAAKLLLEHLRGLAG